MTRLSIVFIAAAACGGHSPKPAGPTGNVGDGGVPSVARTACPAPTADIAAEVAALDANADPLHSDFTPAVSALIGRGLAGGCAVADKLVAPDQDTRMHAQRVLEGVLLGEYGWIAGRGFPNEYSEEQSAAAVKAIWYEWDAEPDALAAGAARWRAWLDGSHGGASSPPDGPPLGDMMAALAAVQPQLERCGFPVDLTVTFDQSGAVSSIYGTAATDAIYRACLQAAVTSVHVQPFHRPEVWIRYPWP